MSGLIERSEEDSAVEAALSAAEHGSGQVLVVTGPAGVGRSAVLAAARDTARARGFEVLQSGLTPVSTAIAASVVRDWIGPLARRAQPGRKPFDGAAAALLDAYAEPRSAASLSALEHLDHAVAWLLDRLGDRCPLLLVVDDVQWADRTSLQALDLVSARLASSPIVAMVALRSGEPGGGDQLLQRICGRARLMRPGPLSVSGVDRLCRSTTRCRLSASAEQIHTMTGGLPFLVTELLRSGQDSPGEAPQPVVEWVGQRLGRLGEPSVAIAQAVAVLGEDATFDGVAELSGLSVAQLADPLDILATAGLVTLGLWRAWPAQPLVGEAVLAAMTPSARSAQHAQAAEYLGRLDRPVQVIAAHLVHTLPDESPEVVELLRAAGEESLAAGAPKVAARQLLRAVGERDPEATDPRLLRLAAAAHLQAGLPDQALELWHLTLSRLADAQERAECLAEVGDAELALGRRQQAAARYASAMELLLAEGSALGSESVRIVAARAAIARFGGDTGRPASIRTRGATFRHPPEQDSYADRLEYAVTARDLTWRGHDLATARALARRASVGGRLLAEEQGDGPGLHLVAEVLTETGDLACGLQLLDAALGRAQASGSLLSVATGSCLRGYLLLQRGDLRQAVADLRRAIESRQAGWGAYVELALAGLAQALVGLGLTRDAATLEPELRAAAQDAGRVGMFPLAAAGLVRAAGGDHDRALADYSAAARLSGTDGSFPVSAGLLELSVWSLLARGRRADAAACARQALDRAGRWGSPRAIGLATYASAATVPPAQAVPLLREAIRLFAAGEAADCLARARIHLGELLLASSPTRAEGAALVRQALGYARRTEVPSLVQRATRVLVTSGYRVAEPAGSRLQALTPGERRVVELAATGRTNRAIASELFVTVKAVEWHLSNAYRKLSIGSRAELPGVLGGYPGVVDPSEAFKNPAR